MRKGKGLSRLESEVLAGIIAMAAEDNHFLGNVAMDSEGIMYVSPEEKFDALVTLLGLGLLRIVSDDENIGFKTVNPEDAEPTDKFEFLRGQYKSFKLGVEARKMKEGEDA